MPLESVSGSIGTTKSGKYTEVRALVGLGVERGAGAHVVRDVGDRDHRRKPLPRGSA